MPEKKDPTIKRGPGRPPKYDWKQLLRPLEPGRYERRFGPSVYKPAKQRSFQLMLQRHIRENELPWTTRLSADSVVIEPLTFESQPAYYPWKEWLRPGQYIVLTRGVDFDCTPGSMRQQVLNASLRNGPLSSVRRTTVRGNTVHIFTRGYRTPEEEAIEWEESQYLGYLATMDDYV